MAAVFPFVSVFVTYSVGVCMSVQISVCVCVCVWCVCVCVCVCVPIGGYQVEETYFWTVSSEAQLNIFMSLSDFSVVACLHLLS